MGPWRDYSADFKGHHIAGKYYFDVLINNDSQWSEVEVLNNTSFEQQRPADRSFNLLEIPVSVRNDRGSPYQSQP